MSNRKNYNSIFFLTTLSVYLGLVLVGTPPILAQAALTQKIEIQNEAEIKDDLDKKPDEDLFAETLIKLVKDLDALSDKKIFDWERESIFIFNDFGFCKEDKPGRYNSTHYLGSAPTNLNVSRRTGEILVTFDKTNAEIAQSFLTKTSTSESDECYKTDSETITVNVSIENKNFNFEFEVTNKNGKIARSFVDSINAYLLQSELSAKTKEQKIVVENTKSKVDDIKILLATHLPRASIDELLAKKNAQ